MYRQRFGLTDHPLPKNAQGKTFFDKSPGFKKLERAFRQLIADPGLGVLTADAGVGKTAALRHLCAQLPKPDYLVIYLCAAVGPFDFYRALAVELGLRPAHRRAELWASLKKSLLHLVDERGIAPILILDEAQHLSDTFFIDLSAFLNFAFEAAICSRCGWSDCLLWRDICACNSTPRWPCASCITSTSSRSIAKPSAP